MFEVLPSALLTVVMSKSGGRGLSPRVWSGIARQMLSPDGYSNASLIGDNLHCFAGAVDTNVGAYSGAAGAYHSYEDTGGSITQLATEVGGVVRLTTDGTDNDEVWLAPGGATSVLGKVASGGTKLFVYETRVRTSQIASGNFYAGLSQEGCAAADTITDAGALADKDFLGFWTLEGDPDSLKFGYRVSGSAVQTVGTFGDISTDWLKLGLVVDPKEPPSRRLRFFVNNLEQSAMVSQADLAGALFPKGEELNALWGVKNSTTSAKGLDVDWWAFLEAE